MTGSLAQLVAAEVRAEMARQQKQQNELASYLNVSQATISRRLAGKLPFRIHDLEVIAEYLEVDVSRFFSRTAA